MKATTLVTCSFLGLTVLMGACASAPQPTMELPQGAACSSELELFGDDPESPSVYGLGIGATPSRNMSRQLAMATARLDIASKVMNDFIGLMTVAETTVTGDPLLARKLTESRRETEESFRGMMTGLSNTANDRCQEPDGTWVYWAQMQADRSTLLMSMVNGIESVVLDLRDNPEIEVSDEEWDEAMENIDAKVREALRKLEIRD